MSKTNALRRLKKALDNKYETQQFTPTAGAVGDGKMFIGGQLYDGALSGVAQVVNVGRPAAATYAPQAGGTVIVRSSGGSTTTTGGGTTTDIASLSLLTVNEEPTLTNERYLAVSSALTKTDGGAGAALTIGMATPPTLSVSSTNDASTGSHAITSSSSPGAAASLLASSAAGNLTLPTFTASTKLTTPLIDTASGNLSLTPAGGTTAITGALTVSASVQTPTITTASNTDLLIDPAGTGAVLFPNAQTIRTSSFDSSTPIEGFQFNEHPDIANYSVLTIGKIQADELAVRVFVADEVRVDRGDEYWTKSYGIVADTFTTPSSIGGTVSVKFEDSPALAGAIFVNNDWVLIRKLDIGTGLTLFNVWGQVATYVNNGDGTQNWTFTLRSGPTSASITKGSLAIDFGASGAALIHLSVIDAAGAPYIKMRKWSGANPYTPGNFTTYVQLGNLGSVGNSYYTPSGNGLYIRSTANEDQFMVADDNGFQIRGASFGLYNGSNQTVLMNNASGINLDEDLWGSWDNRRALQWWPDVSSMSGDPSLSMYTGKAVGGLTDNQNFSYIDANPTGGVLAGLSLTAFGQGTANDATIYLEGGSQSLTTNPSVTITATTIDLVGTPTLSGTTAAQHVNPKVDVTYNLGTALLRWGTLYVNQIIASSISGTTMNGAEWEYSGSMVIDANSASNTTVSVVNQGSGTASLSVEGGGTFGGTLAVTGSITSGGTAVSLAGHTHSEYLATTGATAGATSQAQAFNTGVIAIAPDATTAPLTLRSARVGLVATNLVGGIDFQSNDTNLTAPGTVTARILALANTTHTAAQLGTDLVFYTTTGTTTAESARIASSGATVVVPTIVKLTNTAALDVENAAGTSVFTVNTSTPGASVVGTFNATGALTGGSTAAFTGAVTTPTINTASGGLSIAPANNVTTVTGSLVATTSLTAPTLSTASGSLSIAPANSVTSVTGALSLTGTLSSAGWSITSGGAANLVTAVASTSVTTPTVTTASGNLSLTSTGGTVAVTGALTGSSTATFATSVSAPAITTASGNLSLVPASAITAVTGVIQSPDYTSRTTGWRADNLGGGDFRYLYTDELHTKSFIADLEQALAGSQIISKSVAVLASDFVAPYAGGTQQLVVEDLPSAANMAAFQANDIVLLRSFSRSAGALTTSNCWGTVTGYTDGTGTQTWTFTRSGTTTYNTIDPRGTVTSSTSSAATSCNVAKPTGVVSGDVMIAIVTYDGSADVVTASGWTEIGNANGSDITAHILYKVAGGSEPASYTFSVVNSHAIGAAITAYYNVASSPVDGFAIQANVAGANMTAPATWATSTAGRLIFIGGVSNNTSVTPPVSMTEKLDTGSTGIRVYLAEQDLTASGNAGPKTATIASSSYTSVAALIVLRPTYTSMTSDAGSMTPGTTVSAKSLVLDYGVSGNGYVETTTVDGTYGANSPYQQVVSWTTHPATGQTVRTRTGNLYGLFAQANEYGFYAGNGTTTASAFVRISNLATDFSNVPITMYSSGTARARLNPTAGLVMGTDISASATTTLNFDISTGNLTLGASGGSIVLEGAGSSYFSGVMTIGASGGIYQGTGTFASPTTGLKIWRDSGVGRIGGYNAGSLQWYANTDGKFYAGGGNALLDSNGISVIGAATLRIMENSSTLKGYLYSSNPLDSLLVSSTGVGVKTNGSATSESISLRANSSGGRASEITVEGTNSSGTNRIRMIAYSGSTSTSGQMTLGESSFSLALNGTGTTDFSVDGSGNVVIAGDLDMRSNDISAVRSVSISPPAGVVGVTVTTPTSQTIAGVNLTAANCGSSYGPYVNISHNNNGSTPSAGHITINNKNGVYYSIWPDGSGNLRIVSSAQPTNATDLGGTVVGTQTSYAALKTDVEPWDGDGALGAVMALPLHSYRFKADESRREYHGIVINDNDRGAWFSDNDASNQTPVLNERNLFGYLIAAIKAQQSQIEELKKQLC